MNSSIEVHHELLSYMNSFDLKCIARKVGPQSTSTEAPCRDSLRPQPDSSGGSSRAGVAGEVGESRQMTEAPCSLSLSPGYHAVVLHRHELIVILFYPYFLSLFFHVFPFLTLPFVF